MFCLPIPTLNDPNCGFSKKEAHDKDAGGVAFNNIVVFTSLNLLRQAKVVRERYSSLAMACIDSTHGSDANGGKLMSFGYVLMRPVGNKTSKYRHSYHPLAFSRVLSENFSSAVFTIAALCSAVRVMFGFKIRFLGGLVSDLANSFVNAFTTMFPEAPRDQCYPHVIMKFKDQRGQRKRGTPGYLKHVRRTKSLKVGEADIQNMHKFRTLAMKEKYAELSLRGWCDIGETKIAEVFNKSYVASVEYSGFRDNQFGNEGDSPQRNSLERFHLSSKGTREYNGYCEFGKSLNEMLNHQYPRLVFQVSCRIENFQKVYRIDDLEACNVDSELLGLSSEINGKVDVLGPDEWGVCYYNNHGFCNTPITKERISHHKMALGAFFHQRTLPNDRSSLMPGMALLQSSGKLVLVVETMSCVNALGFGRVPSANMRTISSTATQPLAAPKGPGYQVLNELSSLGAEKSMSVDSHQKGVPVLTSDSILFCWSSI
jgi:hypothetical protein